MRIPHYLMQFFEYAHLRPELRSMSEPFGRLAELLDASLPDNPEKTTALRKLVEAKDCAVRAVLFQPSAPKPHPTEDLSKRAKLENPRAYAEARRTMTAEDAAAHVVVADTGRKVE